MPSDIAIGPVYAIFSHIFIRAENLMTSIWALWLFLVACIKSATLGLYYRAFDGLAKFGLSGEGLSVLFLLALHKSA